MTDSEWRMATGATPALPTIGFGRSILPARVSDELLARYAAKGSARAFAAVYERYHQPLYRYCRSIVRDDADAQDVLQSTFVSALQALRRGRRNAPLRPWLYRIAHNESISVLRHRGREHRREPAVGPAAAPSAEEAARSRARWGELVADLGELPERQRGALLLRELSGLSHEEIAITLGTSLGGAKQAIFEARQALSELEEGRAMRCEDVRRRLSEGDGRALRARRVRAHLHDCPACEAFGASISARRSELRALAPVLSPAAAGALLTRALQAGSAHGAAGATAGMGATSAAAGAGAGGKVAGAAIASKAVLGVALVATTAVGVTGLVHALHHRPGAVTRAPAHVPRHAATPTGSGRRVPGRTGAAPARPGAATRDRARGGPRARGSGVSPAVSRGHGTSAPGRAFPPGLRGARPGASNRSHGAAGRGRAPSSTLLAGHSGRPFPGGGRSSWARAHAPGLGGGVGAGRAVGHAGANAATHRGRAKPR